MENLAGEKDVNEQLKFENLVPEEKKTPEIIPILPGELQPRKVEDVIPDDDIQPDTYIIYPDGGYHPFYGVPNTPPIYQQKIWPYIKRIKFHERWKTEETRNLARRISMRKTDSQANPTLSNGYFRVTLFKETRRTCHTKRGQQWKKRKAFKVKSALLHRLVVLAWIPNPKKKKNVCHINDDRTNYLIENLRWGTHSENMRGKQQKGPDTMEQKYLNLVNRGIIKG